LLGLDVEASLEQLAVLAAAAGGPARAALYGLGTSGARLRLASSSGFPEVCGFVVWWWFRLFCGAVEVEVRGLEDGIYTTTSSA
jgi:hypothetical protein